MNAAERMKMLYDTAENTTTIDEWNGAIVDFSEAVFECFPELIAVVEAAQTYWENTDYLTHDWLSNHELTETLAALDVKLGGTLTEATPESWRAGLWRNTR
jgi:hypothetical protein